MITVFTPAYNRAHLLPRLYESLQRQTFHDFEWVIVDDGSVDETASLFSSNENDNENENGNVKIRYFYQENGGKHRAINRGVKEARGELFFIADSDDWLPDDALETVAKIYDDIRDDASFAGVCGLDGTPDGEIIGSGLPQEVIDDNSLAIRFKLGVTGDMKEVFRTDVMKAFPFPEIIGERFCPEMLVWNRIATKYKLRFFNRIIYLAEYQSDGITSAIVKVRMQSPVASMMTYSELVKTSIVPFAKKVRAAINYWRFRLAPLQLPPIGGETIPKLKWWWNWTMPIGYLMHVRDVHN